MLCSELGIKFQIIRSRTPRNNGKVERNYKNYNERFYKYLYFYSYYDLNLQMKR
ncbi:hypothetical protein HMPREF9129_1990 [Peptoniphilus indolicus ATCC 29427]|uniref:Integrase catalytic domain-containing protein n=1 Tax=Peptoniphilus indolicus ATCC 29427 TaxID=997350 RepID=G4D6G0_9FIRM|nr:hypothetical protein HMPREF9129_1990 [Peptoniphilus indolicus ATCC 29427]